MRTHRGWGSAIAVAVAITAWAAWASAANAAISEEALFRFGSAFGGGAGQLQNSQGIAQDPETGHVFVGGFGPNNRIDEFTPWGEFVKAFGWDVAPGAVNEVQEVRVRAAAGSFKLEFGAASTADLPFNASGAEMEAALDGLATIGGAGGSVSVVERTGAIDGTIPFVYAITFHGSLGAANVGEIKAENGATPLSGGVPETKLKERTRADGTAGGTGLESCTAESGCKAGLAGGGSGQLASVFSVALGAGGNLLVRDVDSNRVQEFSQSGRFVLMFGGNVNKTKVEAAAPEAERNLCTAASGNVCQAGTAGTGKGQFAEGLGLATIGSTIYVGDEKRIQELNEAGEYLKDLPDPGKVLEGKTVRRIATDPKENRLYATLNKAAPFEFLENVVVLDATTGAKLGERKAHQPKAVSVDTHGDLFTTVGAEFPHVPEHVVEYDPAGNQLLPGKAEEEECTKAKETVEEKCFPFPNFEAGLGLQGLGNGPAGNLFIAAAGAGKSFVQAYGPSPLPFESPPPVPPSIDDQFAASVSNSEAEVRAKINPHFFSGTLGTTTYFVQYATAACLGAEEDEWEAPCVAEKPTEPGSKLKGPIAAEDVGVSVSLTGLSPHTPYRYRFVAEGSGRPGVQIIGLGGEEGVEGKDATFTTYTSPSEVVPPLCPANEAFRTGASKGLGDCRAYEMVSPVDKEGGEIRVLGEFTTELPAVLNQSTPSGDALAYGSYKAFGDASSSLFTTQYIARRGATAWSSHAISPPQTGQIVTLLETADTELKFLSPDLCEGWLQTYAEPPLAPGAVAGFANLYRRENCTDPAGYEALSNAEPTGADPLQYQLELQGLSSDRETAIFASGGKLTPAAPSLGAEVPLLYAYKRGEAVARFACILPGGAPSTKACSAGGPVLSLGSSRQRMVRVEHALSEDGSKIFWTSEDGPIYLRENPFGEGTECGEATAPCSVAVSKKGEEESGTVGKGAQYWGAAADGSVAVYLTEESKDLYEFEVGGEATRRIAGKVVGVAGMSADAARIYLVSEEDLDGGGPAKAGSPNLYLRDGGRGGENMRFIATLAQGDVTGTAAIVTAPGPWRRGTQASSDGEELAFMSAAPLEPGYDNHDLRNGQADREVYLYRARAKGGAGSLVCASCNPAGTRPLGANVAGPLSPVFAAATIPVAENNLHEANLIADDGKRLYFESYDSLALADSNGVKDVYQWEATGTGSCKEEGADFVAAAEGCIDLVSSGKSEAASEFDEASPDGSNVFLTTLSSLVPQDPGVLDVYDARVNGGLPSPPPALEECEGESCQHPPGAPPYSAPASTTYNGPEDRGPQRGCPKGKVRKGGRCVAKHHKHKRKAKPHKHKRGAGR